MAGEQNDEEVRQATLAALGAIQEHTAALTKVTLELSEFVATLDNRTEGVGELTEAVEQIQDQEQAKHWVAAQKEALGTYYSEAQKYTTVVIAGGYAAYFTILSILSSRFTDLELSFASLWITISLTIFVLWEVIGMAEVSWGVLFGTLEKQRDKRWRAIGWAAAMLGTLLTALPAAVLTAYVCFKHLL